MDDACPSCLNFQSEFFKIIPLYFGQYTFRKARPEVEYGDILQSSAKGCASCTVTIQAIVALATPDLPNDTKIFLEVFEKGYLPNQPGLFLISFDSQNPFRRRYSDYIELYSLPDCPAPWDLVGSKSCRTVESDSSSPACIDLARLWIKECISSHPRCQASKFPLPKRVIDVGSDNVEPRLYLSQKEEIARYTALSYCWGDFHHITTTKDTLKRRLLGIPVSDLPKTFNDAIFLTRRLGIQYIWIDSLCIIQDDNVDWETESAKMADIYSHTFVTICADEGKDARDGFLGPRAEGILTSVKIPYPATTDNKGQARYVYARNTVLIESLYPITLHNTIPISIAHTRCGVSVLDTRGWTFQERLLSPRTLHYTAAEMAFECKKNALCECHQVPNFFGSEELPNFCKTEVVFKSQISTPYRDDSHMWSNWTAIVENFTRRTLTRNTDRLVAVSGIAAAMHPYTAEDYMCGLWKTRFLQGLLWRVDEVKNSRRQNSYAPSWSWASVTSPISYLYGADLSGEPDHWAQLVSINIKKMSKNLYTQALGSATLRGHLGVANIIQKSSGHLYVKVGPDFEGHSPIESMSTPRESQFLPRWIMRFMPDVDKQLEAKKDDKVYLFIIKIENVGDSEHYPICLVLKPSVGDSSATYFRVGLAVPPCSYEGPWYRHFTVTEVRII